MPGQGPMFPRRSVGPTWASRALRPPASRLREYCLTNPRHTCRGIGRYVSHDSTGLTHMANGRFIIRNSWGTGWGDHGFAYASPAYITAGFFDESYGVTVYRLRL